jgi:hypothetical protein
MKDIVEEKISAKIAKSKLYTTDQVSVVTKLTNEAQIAMFASAPRDLPRLYIQIALKTKEYNLEKERRKRAILLAELEALQQVKEIVQEEERKTKAM